MATGSKHHIRDERDHAAHVRPCHANPVKHGLVARPGNWPFSSVHRDIRAGRYDFAQGAHSCAPSGDGIPAPGFRHFSSGAHSCAPWTRGGREHGAHECAPYGSLTQNRLGGLLGGDGQTVARYEKGESRISGPVDRLIRFWFAFRRLPEEDRHDLIARIETALEQDEVRSETVKFAGNGGLRHEVVG